MMKKTLALLTLLVLSCTSASAFDGYINVTNKTGYTIYFLYISNEKSSTWEEDVLGEDILKNGQTVRVDITNARSPIFDVRAKDEDGDTYTLWKVDISRRDVTFTLSDMD